MNSVSSASAGDWRHDWAARASASSDATSTTFVANVFNASLAADAPPATQRMHDRAAVDVLELAADGHAVRNPRQSHTVRLQHFAHVVCRGFTFDGRVRREDDLIDAARCDQALEGVECERIGADAVDRRQPTVQYEVVPAITAGVLDREDVRR